MVLEENGSGIECSEEDSEVSNDGAEESDEVDSLLLIGEIAISTSVEEADMGQK
jgi:hypothetical protein